MYLSTFSNSNNTEHINKREWHWAVFKGCFHLCVFACDTYQMCTQTFRRFALLRLIRTKCFGSSDEIVMLQWIANLYIRMKTNEMRAKKNNTIHCHITGKTVRSEFYRGIVIFFAVYRCRWWKKWENLEKQKSIFNFFAKSIPNLHNEDTHRVCVCVETFCEKLFVPENPTTKIQCCANCNKRRVLFISSFINYHRWLHYVVVIVSMNEKWYIKRFSSSHATESKNWYLFSWLQFSCGKLYNECVCARERRGVWFLPLHTFPHFIFRTLPLWYYYFFHFVQKYIIWKKNFCGKCYVRWESSCSDAHPHVRIRLTALIHSSIFRYIVCFHIPFGRCATKIALRDAIMDDIVVATNRVIFSATVAVALLVW